MSLQYLHQRASALREQLRQVPINSVEWASLSADLRQVSAQLRAAQGGLRSLPGALS